jgi:hypothetical protein
MLLTPVPNDNIQLFERRFMCWNSHHVNWSRKRVCKNAPGISGSVDQVFGFGLEKFWFPSFSFFSQIRYKHVPLVHFIKPMMSTIVAMPSPPSGSVDQVFGFGLEKLWLPSFFIFLPSFSFFSQIRYKHVPLVHFIKPMMST